MILEIVKEKKGLDNMHTTYREYGINNEKWTKSAPSILK